MLDDIRYPWSQAWAQQLHAFLTQLYPSRSQAAAVAKRADVDLALINVEQAVSYIWTEVLDHSSAVGELRRVVITARDMLPPTSTRREFFDDVLNEATVTTDGQRRTAAGAPVFISGTDDIFEPEALLYHDDLTMQIGQVPSLIATLGKLIERAPAVCKLTVSIPGHRQEGTAFRIGSDLLLTNWHVLHDERTGARATTVSAEFEYEDDGRGGIRQARVVRTDVAGIVGDSADDWAVIRATDPLDDAWPVVRLSGAAVPMAGGSAFVVQHPDGRRKRVGYVRNQISGVDDRVVHYLTDTETGSSGAPVFDAAGDLIAVHHAGGRPQEVLGRPPTVKNEGIRIERIVQGLSAAGITVSE